MLAKLQRAAQKPNSGFDCYTQETMPERWHFTGHRVRCTSSCVLVQDAASARGVTPASQPWCTDDQVLFQRIAPVYCVPHVGWAITSHHELEVVMNGSYAIKGCARPPPR